MLVEVLKRYSKISLNYNDTWGFFELLVFDGNKTFVDSFYGYGENYIEYINIPKDSVFGNWTNFDFDWKKTSRE